jgi:hypothetical protein
LCFFLPVAGQVIDYCEENEMSCAATALAFVPGPGLAMAYTLTAFDAGIRYDECRRTSSSARETRECQEGVLVSGTLSVASIYYQPVSTTAGWIGIPTTFSPSTGEVVAIVSIATIIALASEAKSNEEEEK